VELGVDDCGRVRAAKSFFELAREITLWTATKRTFEAIKRVFTRISNVALWPLSILTAKVKKANRDTMRYAIRTRDKPLLLFAMLRFPALTFGALGWAIFSAHVKPDDVWGPVIGLALLVAKKILALLYYALEEAYKVRRALRMYRRITRAARARLGVSLTTPRAAGLD
jgi:hypothetical protein